MKQLENIVVLMAAYNGEKYIRQQIDSILLQKKVNLTLIISIDKSNDKTAEIVELYSKKNSNIFFYVNEDKKSSSAQNFFRLIKNLEIHKFDYFSFSDQDDIWMEKKLISAIEIIQKGSYDMYSSNVLAFDKKKFINIVKSQHKKKYDYLFEGGGPGNTIVLNKKCFKDLQILCKKTKDIDKIWSHDWFIYAFVRSKNYTNYIDTNSYIYYRQHSENVLGANKGIINIYRRLKFILSGKALDQSRLIAFILNIHKKKEIKNLLFNGKFSLVYILFNIRKCRRKTSDQFKIFIIIILLFFTNNK